MAEPATSLAPARTQKAPAGALVATRRRRRYTVLTRQDRLLLILMVGVPLALDVLLIWGPTVASVFFSFTNWSGIGPITGKNLVGFKNYRFLFSGYTLFWPALEHNLIWLAWMAFIWELQYAPNDGFINNALGLKGSRLIDWLGNPRINLFSALVATSWRHIGYIMILYLAGLKSVDPSLREAARVDGASEIQTFFNVILPVMAPINVIIVVITAIEALRAFDIAYIINQGKNGLELLSILITNNSISEASLVGFGSTIAVVLLVISLGPIVLFLSRTMRTLA